jgi:hypothetical protein
MGSSGAIALIWRQCRHMSSRLKPVWHGSNPRETAHPQFERSIRLWRFLSLAPARRIRRQHEKLAGIDQVGVADLIFVCRKDLGVANTATVNLAADPPETVSARDDRGGYFRDGCCCGARGNRCRRSFGCFGLFGSNLGRRLRCPPLPAIRRSCITSYETRPRTAAPVPYRIHLVTRTRVLPRASAQFGS